MGGFARDYGSWKIIDTTIELGRVNTSVFGMDDDGLYQNVYTSYTYIQTDRQPYRGV